MVAPVTTRWELEPHTKAKHDILKRYLAAWFPILGRYHKRVVYIDGFAGPGRYSKGEDGSPVIALKVARDHANLANSELVFVFIEERADRAAWLQGQEIPALTLPPHIRAQVVSGEFEPVVTQILDTLDAQGSQLAPTFAFVDPFGVSGLPFVLIERLLSRPHCEVLITFMTTTVERFVAQLPSHVNTLIGSADAASLISASTDRVGTARLLYENSLRRCATFVRFFEMLDERGRSIYDLFFASNHALGHERMKEAMWRVDASGAFSFTDRTDPRQITLFTPTPNADLAPILMERFAGRTLVVEEVFSYVGGTAYLATHARGALRSLEDAAQIRVSPTKQDGTRRRPRSFPRGVIVTFAPGQTRTGQ